ncbi:hypothetical protein [Oribacterium sp. WCC10]|uniref:hypothetical protein n=1 Tax=Oribacterium sp. WCC10 TaxID=1855343 RepID=UPI0008EF7332|nr:hypothetical protein [Oribacterium sp. WCC10]SFG74106.1 hypothetical protein SAMN05216356_1232 [Oribacterium sp. WCC10]
MKKKQNKLCPKSIVNTVSVVFLASAFIFLTAFTSVGSKNTGLASKKTQKSKEGSTAWDNLFGKSGKDSTKTYAELKKFKFVSPEEILTQVGFLTLADESGNFIKDNTVTPKYSEVKVEIDDITATKPDKEGFIEVTVPYTIKKYREVVSKDRSVRWLANAYYSNPDFVDLYTGNLIGCYHWWDYRPEEDYDPGITTIKWDGESYTIYDYKGETKDSVYDDEYKEAGQKSDGMHYTMESTEYYKHIFRIPKDYDGLTMVFMKENSEKLARAEHESTAAYIHDRAGYDVFDKDLYYGVEVTADDFYFVKICDYIKE